MNLTRDQRTKLKELSLEVFGVSSYWQKLVDGQVVLVTEKKSEIVPGVDGAPDTTKEIDVPVLRDDGATQSVTKRHTPESALVLLLEMKTRRDQIMATINAQQEENKAKAAQEELQKKIQEDLGGSAT